MSKKQIRKIVLNAAQFAAFLCLSVLGINILYLEWGRGTGKSFFLAYCIKKAIRQMPGATFILVGSSYKQILSSTWPSTKEGLEALGLYENVDYVVGKNGARYGFKSPIQEPNDWSTVVHFSNGSILALVALGSETSGRGLNAYGVFGDEAALFDPEKLFYKVEVANRAFKEIFRNKSMLGCEIYVSSTPVTKKGKWFTDKEKDCKANPKTMKFLKANCGVNLHNLQPGYLKRMEMKSVNKALFNAEIKNIRMADVVNGFYPQLDPKEHYYEDYNLDYQKSLIKGYTAKDLNCKQDNDLDLERPLILSLDWGLHNPAVVSQAHPDVYKVLNSFYAEGKHAVNKVIDEFCDYYESFPNKIVRLYYGHDGNEVIPGQHGVTYGDEVATLLRNRGWRVNDKSSGKEAARHDFKYRLINMMLARFYKKLPKIVINEYNNKDLIISLERAEAGEDRNGIRKIKKDEKNESMNQKHTTHYSDAFDIPLVDLYQDKFRNLLRSA